MADANISDFVPYIEELKCKGYDYEDIAGLLLVDKGFDVSAKRLEQYLDNIRREKKKDLSLKNHAKVVNEAARILADEMAGVMIDRNIELNRLIRTNYELIRTKLERDGVDDLLPNNPSALTRLQKVILEAIKVGAGLEVDKKGDLSTLLAEMVKEAGIQAPEDVEQKLIKKDAAKLAVESAKKVAEKVRVTEKVAVAQEKKDPLKNIPLGIE